MQNATDIAFLLNGATLPAGMTYAKYSHAGAYPLIITALMAAIYVLVTFHPKRSHYQTPATLSLVYLWIMQNVLLVDFAIHRTLNYVEIYSLTHWRSAALIWMGLVAVGLMLIIIRLHLQRSNLWLINANSLAVLAVLFTCSFINFDRTIAEYNVRHAQELTGKGTQLDFRYLQALGSEARPALLWLLQQPSLDAYFRGEIWEVLSALPAGTSKNWRAWTWREHRALKRPVPDNTQDIRYY